MGDITRRITRKSLKAKRKAAIKTIRAQAKEKIRQIKVDYSMDAEKKKQKASDRERKRELKAQKANARLSYNERQPRPFTLGEDLLSSISNGIAAGLGVAAVVLLVIRAVFYSPAEQKSLYIATFSVFGASLFVLHLMETLNHAISSLSAKKVFSVLNHCAVYLFIGGIFSPVLLAQNFTSACAVVWGFCLALTVLYAVFGSRLMAFSVFTYAVFALILAAGIFSGTLNLPKPSKILLLTAILMHAAGLALFVMRNYKWTHGIFHLLAISGSVLSFFGIFYLI